MFETGLAAVLWLERFRYTINHAKQQRQRQRRSEGPLAVSSMGILPMEPTPTTETDDEPIRLRNPTLST
jgi:hypothetical protein